MVTKLLSSVKVWHLCYVLAKIQMVTKQDLEKIKRCLGYVLAKIQMVTKPRPSSNGSKGKLCSSKNSDGNKTQL